MSRTKTGVVRSRKHKKVLELTKGFRGANTRLYKRAHEALLHAGQYAYIGRKLRKRDFRKLWIARITAGLKEMEASLNYSRFISALKKKQIILNRKTLSQLVTKDFTTFKEVVNKVVG